MAIRHVSATPEEIKKLSEYMRQRLYESLNEEVIIDWLRDAPTDITLAKRQTQYKRISSSVKAWFIKTYGSTRPQTYHYCTCRALELLINEARYVPRVEPPVSFSTPSSELKRAVNDTAEALKADPNCVSLLANELLEKAKQKIVCFDNLLLLSYADLTKKVKDDVSKSLVDLERWGRGVETYVKCISALEGVLRTRNKLPLNYTLNTNIEIGGGEFTGEPTFVQNNYLQADKHLLLTAAYD